MGNPVIHFEIAGRDGGRLEDFYGTLFDWTIHRQNAGGFPYGFVTTGSEDGIDGGIRHEPQGRPEVVFYVQVPDLDAAVAHAEALGATVRIPPTNVEALTFALIADPEGNPVGLVQRP